MGSVNSTLKLEDRMTPVLRSITKALESTLTAMASVDKVGANQFNAAKAAIVNASNAVNQFGNSAETAGNKAQNGANKATNSFNNVKQSVRGVMGELGTLIGLYSGFQGLFQIGVGADTFIANTARLNLMNDGLLTTKELQDEIYKSSQRSLSNYRETTAAVAKLGITAGHAFSSTKEIVAFTELLNKQFQIGGASASEKAGAMYQLTQAMASGRLQGDEFRSILENAPMLMAAIRKSTGMTFQELKKASTEGRITAQVIKKALFDIAEETNDTFAKMPMKFGDLWTQMLNKIDKGLQPLYSKLGEMYNNPEFQQGLDNMVNGFVKLAEIAVPVLSAISYFSNGIADNLSIISPIIWGLIGTFLALKIGAIAAFASAAYWAAVTKIGITLLNIATFMGTLLTKGWSAAFAGLAITAGSAAAAVGWIIAAVIAAIAIFYVVIAVINKITGSTYSATGIIMGILNTAVAFIWNLLLMFFNFCFIQFQQLYNAVAILVNFFANVWDSPVTSWINAIKGGAIAILNIINNLASAIDSVLGTSLSKGVQSWISGVNKFADKAVDKWGKDEKYKEVMKTSDKNLLDTVNGALGTNFSRAGYKNAWEKGNATGRKWEQGIKDTFSVGNKREGTYGMFANPFPPGAEGAGAGSGPTNSNTKATKDNTKALQQNTELTTEDIELLKEVARVQFVNRFTTLTPQVTATFGDVRETADVNGIMQTIKQSVEDALVSSLQI